MTLFGIIPVRLLDFLEILLVAYILYKLYRMIRGTLAVSIFAGLLGLYLVQFLVNATGMKILQATFGALSDIYVLAVVIIFQPEIRRVLQIFGENPLFRQVFAPTAQQQKSLVSAIRETVDAVAGFSERCTGAILVFKRYAGLRTYMETGETLQANLTKSLLDWIFDVRNLLHDGAVIIAEGRVQAARCILPISRNQRVGPTHGLRHRAAVGLTEETDAFVVVVSEETGRISVVEEGSIVSNVTVSELRSHLSEALGLTTLSEAALASAEE